MALRVASVRSATTFNALVIFTRRTYGVQVRNASAMAVPTSSHQENLSHDAQVRGIPLTWA